MRFSIYDILSNLIPGFLILVSIYVFMDHPLGEIDITVSLVIAYLIGYINNTLSSWSEDTFNWTWGGKPSNMLLNGKDIWKVRFYDNKKVREMLERESTDQNKDIDSLFQIAMRYAHPSSNDRVKDFNSNYALSRNLIISVLISAILLNIKYWFSIAAFAISLLVFIIVWLRAKQRGYYYAREVLNTYLNIKEKQ